MKELIQNTFIGKREYWQLYDMVQFDIEDAFKTFMYVEKAMDYYPYYKEKTSLKFGDLFLKLRLFGRFPIVVSGCPFWTLVPFCSLSELVYLLYLTDRRIENLESIRRLPFNGEEELLNSIRFALLESIVLFKDERSLEEIRRYFEECHTENYIA